MLIQRLLSAENAAPQEESFGTVVKNFFTELFYGGSDMQYENFSFGNQIVTYRMIIIAIALGLIIASGVMIYKRKVLGRLVRALDAKGAVSSEKAQSLSELGLSGNRIIISSLKRGTLKRMVGCVEKDEHDEKMLKLTRENSETKNKKKVITDYASHPENDRYYLPENEDKRKDMLSLFSEKGSGVGGFILTVIFCIIGAAVLFTLVPFFIGLFDNAL